MAPVSVVLWTVVVIGALILMANFSDPDGGQIAMASIAIAAALAILYMKVKPMQKMNCRESMTGISP